MNSVLCPEAQKGDSKMQSVQNSNRLNTTVSVGFRSYLHSYTPRVYKMVYASETCYISEEKYVSCS